MSCIAYTLTDIKEDIFAIKDEMSGVNKGVDLKPQVESVTLALVDVGGLIAVAISEEGCADEDGE